MENGIVLAPKIKLNNGRLLPSIGLGSVLAKESPEQFQESVLSALKIGYRHFDTARLYGTEALIGEALQVAFKGGLVKREDVFVTTKVWCDKNTPAEIISELHESLKCLQLDYVDCYMIHMPVRCNKFERFLPADEEDYLPFDLNGAWDAMEQLLDRGLTKSVGVSNFCVKKMKELLINAKVVPAINQVELHPMCHQTKLRAYCAKMGIHVSGWCPLGAPDNSSYGTNDVLDNPILKTIAIKHGKTVAQVSLRWALETGCSTLPKSANASHQKENFSIFDFSLTDEDHAIILEIPQRKIFGPTHTGLYRLLTLLWDDGEEEVAG